MQQPSRCSTVKVLKQLHNINRDLSRVAVYGRKAKSRRYVVSRILKVKVRVANRADNSQVAPKKGSIRVKSP